MRWRAIVCCFALFGVLAFAQEDSEPQASAAAEPRAAAAGETDEAAPDEEFVPTKEVPADDEITFPVDI